MVIAIAVAVEVVNSLLLIGMLAFARHAWLTMPPSVPFPRLERSGRLNEEWDFKENVLAHWLFADVITWLVTSVCIMGPAVAAGSQAMTPNQATVLPFVLIFPGIIFAFQHSALKKARALEAAIQAETREDTAQPDAQAE
jgi:hypothetical protein